MVGVEFESRKIKGTESVETPGRGWQHRGSGGWAGARGKAQGPGSAGSRRPGTLNTRKAAAGPPAPARAPAPAPLPLPGSPAAPLRLPPRSPRPGKSRRRGPGAAPHLPRGRDRGWVWGGGGGEPRGGGSRGRRCRGRRGTCGGGVARGPVGGGGAGGGGGGSWEPIKRREPGRPQPRSHHPPRGSTGTGSAASSAPGPARPGNNGRDIPCGEPRRHVQQRFHRGQVHVQHRARLQGERRHQGAAVLDPFHLPDGAAGPSPGGDAGGLGGGNNGTTVTAAVLANKLGLSWMTKTGRKKANYYGSLLQASTVCLGTGPSGDVYVPFRDLLPMVHPNDIVFDGWDISSLNLAEAMRRAEEERADNVLRGSMAEQVEQIRRDIRDFRESSGVDKVIVLWTANTERFCDVVPGLNDTADNLLRAIERGLEVSPSSLFAVASILEGCAYINGSPQNTFVPGAVELAAQRRVFICGDDFKSGQTKLKSVLVDFLVGAGLKTKSIDKPDHCVVIKYVPYVGDSKRALDEYTSEIMMGGTNTIVIHNTCEDSLLASPIILDLGHPDGAAPLVPEGTPVVNALFRQRSCIENILRACLGLPPQNHMLLEHKMQRPVPSPKRSCPGGAACPLAPKKAPAAAHLNGHPCPGTPPAGTPPDPPPRRRG
ncbi:unnamed protein product [Bubo scandiacus]